MKKLILKKKLMASLMKKFFDKKTLTTTFFFVLIAFFNDVSLAGKHDEEKDSFDGTTIAIFRATPAEVAKSRLEMWLSDFRAEQSIMLLNVVGPLGVDCERKGFEIKTHDGVIHHISWALEKNFTTCGAMVKVEWLVKSFTVRIPMRDKASLIGRMDTTSLKPERYRHEKK